MKIKMMKKLLVMVLSTIVMLLVSVSTSAQSMKYPEVNETQFMSNEELRDMMEEAGVFRYDPCPSCGGGRISTEIITDSNRCYTIQQPCQHHLYGTDVYDAYHRYRMYRCHSCNTIFGTEQIDDYLVFRQCSGSD